MYNLKTSVAIYNAVQTVSIRRNCIMNDGRIHRATIEVDFSETIARSSYRVLLGAIDNINTLCERYSQITCRYKKSRIINICV